MKRSGSSSSAFYAPSDAAHRGDCDHPLIESSPCNDGSCGEKTAFPVYPFALPACQTGPRHRRVLMACHNETGTQGHPCELKTESCHHPEQSLKRGTNGAS